MRLVTLDATIAAVSRQKCHYCDWAENGRICPAEYSTRTNGVISQCPGKSIKIYIWAWCFTVDTEIILHWYSGIRLRLQVLNLPVKLCVHPLTRAFIEHKLDFPMWLKMCWNVHYLLCLHENITSACSKRKMKMREWLSVTFGLDRRVLCCSMFV